MVGMKGPCGQQARRRFGVPTLVYSTCAVRLLMEKLVGKGVKRMGQKGETGEQGWIECPVVQAEPQEIESG